MRHSGLLPISQIHRAFARAERCGKRSSTGFVTHIRTIRKIVGAEFAREQLVKKGGLVTQTARCVEGCAIWAIKFLKMAARQRKRFVPSDGHIFVAGCIVTHRLRKPAYILKCKVGPPHQIGRRVQREEIGSHSLSSHLPCGMLNTVLADIEPQSFPVVRPRASGAIETSVLVIHL
jgi:hypothetical protein